ATDTRSHPTENRCIIVATCIVVLASGLAEAQHKPHSILMGAKTSAAQRRAATGQGEWATFLSAFQNAVRKRDRFALRTLMSDSFEWAGDGKVSSADAINYIDQGIVSWQNILKSINGGVINCKYKDSSCWNFSGRQAKRTTKPNWLVFELGSDSRWKWARLVGD
ncbi:MAG: hypothetical protein ACREEM_21715, partial [Blastocatellia bacterium]